MDIVIGETYKSPKHGRLIQVMGIQSQNDTEYNLAILFVDKDTYQTEAADLKVSKSDVKAWTLVNY